MKYEARNHWATVEHRFYFEENSHPCLIVEVARYSDSDAVSQTGSVLYGLRLGKIGDGIECLVLAQLCAGVEIDAPWLEALDTALDAGMNHS